MPPRATSPRVKAVGAGAGHHEARLVASGGQLGQVSKVLVAVARQALAVDRALVKLADERARAARDGASVFTMSDP